MNELLRPFTPTKSRPWDGPTAAHLLRRAGFSPSATELKRALSDGITKTVNRLVDGGEESSRHRELDALGEALSYRDDIERLRSWWLLRMRHTDRPLHARLAVFWHDHFATSNVKVRNPLLMYRQLRTIESNALRPFAGFLLAMSRDPAMIVWLDGDLNVKGRPNENYAREVFELFSLGVGNYTERDIKEAARAFTGWHQKRGAFRFAARSHDDGAKEIFGEKGRFGGDDVVRLALARPAASVFIATKLLREFVCPAPGAALVEAAAARVRETGFDTGEVLRTLLASCAMFDPAVRGVRIKSPVELVIGLARSLELRTPGQSLSRATSQMGQRLFEPPSVKGWDGHRKWVGTATMLVRLNTALAATRPAKEGKTGLRPDELASRYRLSTAAEARRFAADLALDGRVPAAMRRRLEALDGKPADVLARSLRLLVASPEYQMA